MTNPAHPAHVGQPVGSKEQTMSEASAELPAEATDADLEWHLWPPIEHRPGGQQVRRTCVGVLVIHKPTGLAAVSVDGRSQHANKQAARGLLQAHLDMRPITTAACEERERLRDLLSEACCDLEEGGFDATAESLRQRGGAFDERRDLANRNRRRGQ